LRTRDRGMRRARAARAPRVGFAVVATTHIANLLVLRFAPRARMGRSGLRLLSLDAGVTGAARRAIVGSDGSASTACFASMWHPPLRRSGGVFRHSACSKTQATCGFAAGRLIISYRQRRLPQQPEPAFSNPSTKGGCRSSRRSNHVTTLPPAGAPCRSRRASCPARGACTPASTTATGGRAAPGRRGGRRRCSRDAWRSCGGSCGG